ncbi:MAG: hypothetical protein J5I64_03500, partial [Saprospiraceae bacterium]|nr:hypothetical protein [Saprospiraceae bacterium]
LTTHQNKGKKAGLLTVRSKDKFPDSSVNGAPLSKNEEININNKWIKIFDSENGEAISGINKL